MHFIDFYRERLSNEHWGEQVHVRGNNELKMSLTIQGLSTEEAKAVWQPFLAWVGQHPEMFESSVDMGVAPAAKVFDVAFFEKVSPKDVRPTRTEGQDLYYWAGNQDEVSAYWYAYQSRWLPLDRFDAARRDELARAFFDASRSWTVALHFNKGLAGAPEEALARSRQTSVNPAVERAAALVIMAANGSDVHPGVKGYEPDVATGEKERERVSAGMKIINAVAGDAGSYVNETDYFEPNWQHVFWGENYARLLELKKKYDPDGLLFCHHCVGSEMWSSDGMCKKSAL